MSCTPGRDFRGTGRPAASSAEALLENNERYSSRSHSVRRNIENLLFDTARFGIGLIGLGSRSNLDGSLCHARLLNHILRCKPRINALIERCGNGAIGHLFNNLAVGSGTLILCFFGDAHRRICEPAPIGRARVGTRTTLCK